MKIPEKINLAKVGIFAFRISVGLLIFFALTRSCKPSVQVADKNEPIKIENQIIEVSKAEDKRKIEAMTIEIQSLRNELANSKVSKAKDKKAVKSIIENGEVADYYNNRYGFNDSRTTERGTEIGDSTAYQNITDLIDLDYCKKDFATLNKMFTKCDSTSFHYKALWEKTEKQKDNNFKMYQNDSKALADLRKENNREVKFSLSMHFDYGNTIDFVNPTYKASIFVFDKNRNSYSGGADHNRTFYVGFGKQIFQIKGKKK